MDLNQTPAANRIHITLFGKRNSGKSSLINALTAQTVSNVSNIAGTTTDVVSKSMELLPLGPVVLYDTPGYDDEGELGSLRVNATKRAINHTQIALLVIDASSGADETDLNFKKFLEEKNIPIIEVYNKADKIDSSHLVEENLYVSALTNFNVDLLKKRIANISINSPQNRQLVADLIEPNDVVLLVIPIDDAAPKGRLILPQQQVMRDILDANATFIACKETELSSVLNKLKDPPKLVITDSQVFNFVSKTIDESIPLTSFSVLFARYKGDFDVLLNGAQKIDNLNDGDTILISEACTHHRQCGDIGTQKLPKWIQKYTKKQLNFEFSSGMDFPSELSKYSLIVHCGGCMINEQQMKNRIEQASKTNIPIVNYGLAIAKLNGILSRAVAPLKKKDK